ncbi:MAG: peptidylprolyl isomerase [Bacteroidota bacterium]
MQRLIFIAGIFLAASCSTKAPSPNKFFDAGLVKIYDLKDRRMTDSLLTFLQSENPVYRREAAFAFGSVQDSAASLALGSALLEDPDAEVRKNAAFSLGQTGGTQAVNALIPALSDSNKAVLREVLEGLGKTVQEADINVLRDFQSNDSISQEGLAWGFYNLGVRKKSDSVITRKVAQLLTNKNSFQTRLGAASYFARSQKVEGKGFEEKLIVAAQHDPNVYVRMMAASGFRHLEASEALYILKEIIATDADYRVRVNAVRASQFFPLDESEEVVFSGLADSVEMVKVAASEVIVNKAEGYKGTRIQGAIEAAISPRVKSNLYAASFRAKPAKGLMEEIVKAYPQASVYHKSYLVTALGEARGPDEEKAFEFISAELLNEKNEHVIRTSAAAALVSMNTRPGTRVPLSRFLQIYGQAISNNDEAVTGVIAGALMNQTLKYKEEIKDLQFLYDAKAKLKLPKDIESLQPIENAIAYLEGKERPPQLKNEFNNPVDWTFVKTIPSSQKVEIKTTKGTITLQLLVSEAPGSTANFLTLIKKKYYDGKFFHRVVPNFVIQTGCNRGDGYGSEDYSIRSEFSLRRYVTGSVGMASAGKDTEGTQWFITHCPTPHLDGRYTIFARTISGMDVVHKIEVGDKILEVSLK